MTIKEAEEMEDQIHHDAKVLTKARKEQTKELIAAQVHIDVHGAAVDEDDNTVAGQMRRELSSDSLAMEGGLKNRRIKNISQLSPVSKDGQLKPLSPHATTSERIAYARAAREIKRKEKAFGDNEESVGSITSTNLRRGGYEQEGDGRSVKSGEVDQQLDGPADHDREESKKLIGRLSASMPRPETSVPTEFTQEHKAAERMVTVRSDDTNDPFEILVSPKARGGFGLAGTKENKEEDDSQPEF